MKIPFEERIPKNQSVLVVSFTAKVVNSITGPDKSVIGYRVSCQDLDGESFYAVVPAEAVRELE